MLVLTPVLATLALAIGSPAFAQPYFPLAIGNSWDYQTAGGAHETQTITGTTTVFGHDVFVNTFANNPDNAGLENYWQVGSNGGVLLFGFYRGGDGFGILYDPPLTIVDAPLALGKTWSSEATFYRLPGMTPDGTFTVSFSAYEDVMLTVPAGTFHAFGIGQYLPPGSAKAFASGALNLDGTLRVTTSQATDWYTAGVGEVQYGPGDLFELVGLNLPTPAGALSWGYVKAIYRK
jgi:hypothetical protein